MVGSTLEIGNNNIEIPQTKRSDKGKSYIDFPSDFCVIDIETTGWSPEWDEIIEIGAIKYSNGQEIDRFQSLIQPHDFNDDEDEDDYYEEDEDYDEGYLDNFIVKLTGITDDMLASAPKTSDVIQTFADFIENSIIIGYNVTFYINFLYDNFQKYINKPLKNNHIDIRRIARRLHPELPHHRLEDIVKIFNLTNDQAHRAIGDCIATYQCYEKLHTEVLEKYNSEEDFIKTFSYSGTKFKAADIKGDESKVDVDSPIYNKYCVFTGKLEKFARKEAMQIVADLGGLNQDRITKQTNFLILGNNDYCSAIKDGKSTKQKKAEQYKLAGQDIEIIPETVFYDMLGDDIL